ncbi:MAG: NAD-dependent deacetylase [Cytophagales bacterium]|nr:MAG: NAD-dependent deacetylase [Cytophagales bacterium]
MITFVCQTISYILTMNELQTIKTWIENANAIVINTGAGMGVDSGLADYRGNGGQWGQVENDTQKSIFEVVNPQGFLENPKYSWTLFGKRIKEYAETQPHNGYRILKNWITNYHLDYFCLTSNIDSHFQKSGFAEENIRELHGTLAYFQSSRPDLAKGIWKNELSGDEIIANAQKEIFPMCPISKVLARPNVYMFRDETYIDTRSKEQEKRFQLFLERNKEKNILVFEIGSGPHVQTIRIKTRMLRSEYKANIVRINPKDYTLKPPHIGIPKGALEALTEINNYLSNE